MSDFNNFFNIKTPRKGYHVPNGKDELLISKNLSFQCGCGGTHNVNDAFAHINFPLENKTLFSCPDNKMFFVLVRPKGIFKIKGLKTVAIYKAKDDQEVQSILNDIENRKKRN